MWENSARGPGPSGGGGQRATHLLGRDLPPHARAGRTSELPRAAVPHAPPPSPPPAPPSALGPPQPGRKKKGRELRGESLEALSANSQLSTLSKSGRLVQDEDEVLSKGQRSKVSDPLTAEGEGSAPKKEDSRQLDGQGGPRRAQLRAAASRLRRRGFLLPARQAVPADGRRKACPPSSESSWSSKVLRWHRGPAMAPRSCDGTEVLRWHQGPAMAPRSCDGTKPWSKVLRWHELPAMARTSCDILPAAGLSLGPSTLRQS